MKIFLNKCSTGEFLLATQLVEMERNHRQDNNDVRWAGILKSYWRLDFLIPYNVQYRHLQELRNFHISTYDTQKQCKRGEKNKKESETNHKTVNLKNKIIEEEKYGGQN